MTRSSTPSSVVAAAAAALVFVAACLVAPASGQPTSKPGFTLQSLYGLSEAPDLTNRFGPEDKLIYCSRDAASVETPWLVFVDLDEVSGQVFSSQDDGSSWMTTPITGGNCPDPNQEPAPLIPRDGSYSLGKTKLNATSAPGGVAYDRLLIMGGDGATENNVVRRRRRRRKRGGRRGRRRRCS